jgi:beta-glucosidase 2, glycosyl-hydrolase family 116 N-term
MERREFLKASALGMASTGVAAAGVNLLLADTNKDTKPGKRDQGAVDPDKVYSLDSGRLFPSGLPTKQWVRFEAEGFSKPACGILYHREDVVPHGMPLGGVATGYMDVDTDGTFGYFNLFNSGVPTRGPLKHGLLGISSGDRCWVLTTQDMTGTENAADIQYWGHYPVADVNYELDAPFQVGLRAWSPFIPGDSRGSNTPAAVFEVHVRNRSDEAHKVTLGFSFPGPTQAEAQISPTSDREMRYIDWWPTSDPVANGTIPAERERVRRGSFHGQVVRSPLGTEYAIGLIDDVPARFGAAVWVHGYDYATGQQWTRIREDLPRVGVGDFSSSLATDFSLSPGEEKVVRIVVAWYSPIWKGDKTNTYARMYTKQYKDATDIAGLVADSHASLQRRVLLWQQAVYTADEYPVWLREGLVNILHLMPKTDTGLPLRSHSGNGVARRMGCMA